MSSSVVRVCSNLVLDKSSDLYLNLSGRKLLVLLHDDGVQDDTGYIMQDDLNIYLPAGNSIPEFIQIRFTEKMPRFEFKFQRINQQSSLQDKPELYIAHSVVVYGAGKRLCQDNRLFDKYQQKSGFDKQTHVQLLDDDYGYYLAKVGTNEILDITFKNPREAVKHAFAEYWVMDTRR